MLLKLFILQVTCPCYVRVLSHCLCTNLKFEGLEFSCCNDIAEGVLW